MVTLAAIAASAVAAAVVMTVTAVVGGRQGRVVVVDIAWGPALALAAIAAAAVGSVAGSGDPARAWAVAAGVLVWGGRLARHVRRRDDGGEDPRYRRLLGGDLAEVGMGVAVRKVFGVQGLAACLIALPVTVGTVADTRWWPAFWVGAALWLLGLCWEAIGDAQLAAYRARPREQRPPVLDTGLWRYSRHPNYFGDACVWWGVWAAAGLAAGPVVGAATLVAPLAMTYFLVWATGARLLEQTMLQRPAYRSYARRTSMFVPLPPRRR